MPLQWFHSGFQCFHNGFQCFYNGGLHCALRVRRGILERWLVTLDSRGALADSRGALAVVCHNRCLFVECWNAGWYAGWLGGGCWPTHLAWRLAGGTESRQIFWVQRICMVVEGGLGGQGVQAFL